MRDLQNEGALPGAAPAPVLPYLVAVVFFMQLLDTTIIATSLPVIAHSFGADPVALGSAFTIYMLAMAAFLPAAGALSQRLGARNLLALAIVLFAMASLLCANSNSLAMFITARALQGAAASMMAPVGRILVLQGQPPERIVQTIATITWPGLFAPVLGPVVGGWISAHFGWQWNFYLNLPLCAVAVVALLLLVPNQRGGTAGRFDWLGFALSSGAVVAVLLGLELFVAGHGLLESLALIALGTAAVFWLGKHLRRVAAPIFQLNVLAVQSFRATTMGPGTLCRISINASPFLLPLLFQLGFGLNAIEAGYLLLVYFAGNLSMKAVSTPALRKFGYRNILVWNGIGAGLAVAAFAALPLGTNPLWFWPLLFIAGLLRSMQFTALATLSVAEIEADARPSSMVLSAMMQQISMVLGVALSVAVIRVGQWVHLHAEAAQLADFRAALVVMGLIGVLGGLMFLRLNPDVGEATSGHHRRLAG